MSQMPEPASAPATVSSGRIVPEPAESTPEPAGAPAPTATDTTPTQTVPAQPAPAATPPAQPTPAATSPAAPAGPPLPPPSPAAPASTPARLIAGVLVGAVIAVLGGLILGEYPFTGFMPYIAGVLFAMVVTEVIVSISRRHDAVTAGAAALCSLGGLGLAVRISSGDGVAPIPVGGWVALAVGLAVALVTGGLTAGVGRGRRSRRSS